MIGDAWLKRTEQRYAWSFFGAVIGLVALAATFASLRERQPAVRFALISDSNVLDVHKPMAALDILYDGVSLQRNNLTLRVLTIRVENSGDVDVLQSHYDTESPWGLHLTAGRVVSANVVAASSEYLRNRFSARVSSETDVTLSKAILDRGSHALVEILVLVRPGESLVVTPIGKIAGIPALRMTREIQRAQGGFWARTLGGSPFTQFSRLVIYGVAFIVGCLCISGLVVAIVEVLWSSPNHERRRRRTVKRLFRDVSADARSQCVIASVYVRGDLMELRRFGELLTDRARLQELLDTMPEEERRDHKRAASLAQAKCRRKRFVELSPRAALFVMENEGLLRRS